MYVVQSVDPIEILGGKVNCSLAPQKNYFLTNNFWKNYFEQTIFDLGFICWHFLVILTSKKETKWTSTFLKDFLAP